MRVFKEHLTFLYFMGKEHKSVLSMTLISTSLINSHQALLLQNVLKINFLCLLYLGMIMKIEEIIKMNGLVIYQQVSILIPGLIHGLPFFLILLKAFPRSCQEIYVWVLSPWNTLNYNHECKITCACINTKYCHTTEN